MCLTMWSLQTGNQCFHHRTSSSPTCYSFSWRTAVSTGFTCASEHRSSAVSCVPYDALLRNWQQILTSLTTHTVRSSGDFNLLFVKDMQTLQMCAVLVRFLFW